MRIGGLHIGREVLLDSVAHNVAAVSVQLAVFFDMAFEIIVFHVHSNFTLGDAWCGKVGGAFDEVHLCKDFIVAYEPCQEPVSWRRCRNR